MKRWTKIQDPEGMMIVHVTFPDDFYIVFQDHEQKEQWERENAHSDIRFEEIPLDSVALYERIRT